MGGLVVIEGLDGAGKNTLTRRLFGVVSTLGVRATAVAFPRYAVDVHAELVRDALYGRMGDLADSVHAMAVLFASGPPRGRRRPPGGGGGHDVVLVDRYVASNAAYGAARLHQGAGGRVRRLGARAGGRAVRPPRPRPAPAPGRAPRRRRASGAAHRERTEPERARDRYESDAGLQDRTAEVYGGLAAAGWLAPWTVLDGAADLDRTDPGHAGLARRSRGLARPADPR